MTVLISGVRRAKKFPVLNCPEYRIARKYDRKYDGELILVVWWSELKPPN